MLKIIKSTFLNDILFLYVITSLKYPLGENQLYLGLLFAAIMPLMNEDGKPFGKISIRKNIRYIFVKYIIAVLYVLFIWYVVIHSYSQKFSKLFPPESFFLIGAFFFLLFILVNTKLWSDRGE